MKNLVASLSTPPMASCRYMNPTRVFIAMRTTLVGVATFSETRKRRVRIENVQMSIPLRRKNENQQAERQRRFANESFNLNLSYEFYYRYRNIKPFGIFMYQDSGVHMPATNTNTWRYLVVLPYCHQSPSPPTLG